MGKTVGPLVESVSLLQKKQAALAIVEFREANGVGPDDALDLRSGTVACLQQDNFWRRAQGEAEVHEVLVLAQERELIRPGVLPYNRIGHIAKPDRGDVN